MQAAAAARDADALRKAAHGVKSSSANVGAEHLSRLCKDLEMLGREGTTDGAADLLAQVASEFDRVAGSLKAQLERRPPAQAA
jgi:HPt (histidine-containing phosphotransfer) domain-containing protein